MGPQGPQGPAGPAGPSNSQRPATTPVTDGDVLAGDVVTDTTDCPAGKVVLGGGEQVAVGNGGSTFGAPRFYVSESRALDADTWQVSVVALSEFSGNGNQDEATVTAHVVCSA